MDFGPSYGEDGTLRGRRYSYVLLLFQERHHLAELGADLLHLLVLRRFAHGQELVAAALVFGDPSFGEFAGLNLRQNLLHLGARLFVNDARTASVVAILRGIRN